MHNMMNKPPSPPARRHKVSMQSSQPRIGATSPVSSSAPVTRGIPGECSSDSISSESKSSPQKEPSSRTPEIASSTSSEFSAINKQNCKDISYEERISTNGDSIPLIPGEKEFLCRDVTYLNKIEGPIKGTLHLTNYKLHFLSRDRSFFVDAPLGVINRVEKVGGASSRGENSYGIEVFCRDVRSLKFAYNPENHSRREFFDELKNYAFPSSRKGTVFAFSSEEKLDEPGWSVYEPLKEYKRMGVPNESWRISKVNDKYETCDTYPAIWAVPVGKSDEELKSVAQFRSRGRIPILAWINKSSQATITRCSQPLVGVSSKRNKDDEEYLQSILEANAQAHKLYVFDARPNTNAVANFAKGGGYESEDNYQSIELSFLDVHNIHIMRESQRKLTDDCYPIIDDNKWLSSIESSRWLEHTSRLISGALRIVDKVSNNKTSVLVHCSDGWDRTAQLTSLSMLLLDSYYRTIRGFEVLIEKEWNAFGHRFHTRIGHGDEKHSDSERSPIFVQWLDCVYQITVQFPYAFEFNEYFLLTILEHLYSCRFGTFLCNSEKERKETKVQEKTNSLWSFINSEMNLYINPFYSASYETSEKVLLPSPAIRHLKIWKGYYCKWNMRMRSQEPTYKKYQKLQEYSSKLTQTLEKMKLEAAKRNLNPIGHVPL